MALKTYKRSPLSCISDKNYLWNLHVSQFVGKRPPPGPKLADVPPLKSGGLTQSLYIRKVYQTGANIGATYNQNRCTQLHRNMTRQL